MELQRFSETAGLVLVATDLASRGLDVPEVQHVIMYELPSQVTDYLHRAGRTGRAGRPGLVTSFVRKHDIIASLLAPLLAKNLLLPTLSRDLAKEANRTS